MKSRILRNIALIGGAVLFGAVGKRIIQVRSVNAVLIITMLGPVAALALVSSTTSEKANLLAPFDEIEFRTKPNIHIVSVDALSPLALVEKHLGLTNLPYARVLDAEGVVVFKNAFASRVSTGPSLNSLMRLAHADFSNDLSYFAGRTNGPVAQILHRNGYTIATRFDQHFFGRKGPFVDAYLP